MLWGFADQRFSVGCVAGHFIRVWGGMLPNNPILWVRWYCVEEFFIWSQDKRHDFISRLLLRDWIGIIHPKLNTFVICHIIYLFEQRPNSCPKVPWNVAMRSTRIQSLHQLRSTGRMCGCTTVGQGHTLDSLGHSHPLAGQCPSMSKYWWFQGLGSQEFSIEIMMIMITTRDRKRTLKPPIWILYHGSASINGQTSQGFKSRRKRWPIIWWIGNALDSRRFQWRRTCSDSSFLPFSWSETTSGPSKGLAVQSFAVPRAGWEVPVFYVKLYIYI